MTYIEKLMSAVKFDDEMLTQEEIGRLRESISERITLSFCPVMFELLRRRGAKMPEIFKDLGECGFEGMCEDCWAQEIAQ